mmetsp:Transcript_6145/g.12766  ORF Transcript_6145/g.12766 Transcript_6145/m.12766 type:complete len:245 (-) Transcript_6145:1759-2493(-)
MPVKAPADDLRLERNELNPELLEDHQKGLKGDVTAPIGVAGLKLPVQADARPPLTDALPHGVAKLHGHVLEKVVATASPASHGSRASQGHVGVEGCLGLPRSTGHATRRRPGLPERVASAAPVGTAHLHAVPHLPGPGCHGWVWRLAKNGAERCHGGVHASNSRRRLQQDLIKVVVVDHSVAALFKTSTDGVQVVVGEKAVNASERTDGALLRDDAATRGVVAGKNHGVGHATSSTSANGLLHL